MTTTDVTAMLGGKEVLHQPRGRDQCYDKKKAQAIIGIE
jgi:hypothetical protein